MEPSVRIESVLHGLCTWRRQASQALAKKGKVCGLLLTQEARILNINFERGIFHPKKIKVELH